MVNPVGTASGEANRGTMTVQDKHARDAHITKVDINRLMDVPSPTSNATLTKSKAMAVEGVTERSILLVTTRKKDAAVPTSNTASTNTKRVDRAMGTIPGPRGVKSMMTV